MSDLLQLRIGAATPYIYIISPTTLLFLQLHLSYSSFYDAISIITFLSFYRQVPIGRRLRVCVKGLDVPRVNKLKKLIREKQAENKRKTGKHLSQAAIAVEMGIDPATLSEYMNDKVGSLNWDVWQKLANYFGVSGDEIFNVLPE